MKSLKLIALALLAFFNLAKAKDTVFVSHDRSTELLFDQPIVGVNPVNPSLLFEVKGQALALKAQSADFAPTNLTVKTVDGKQYKFDLLYSYGRAGEKVKANHPEENFLQAKPIRELSLTERFRNIKRMKSIDRSSIAKMIAKVGKVYVSGDSFLFKLHLENHSNINYDIDFVRFYIRDLKTAKRTVTQERELYPIEQFGTACNTVKSGFSCEYLYALKKFPITKDQGLFIEIYEKNGGRHLYLAINQKDITRAKSLQSIFN
jgi:conjugative transposon TraN protein